MKRHTERDMSYSPIEYMRAINAIKHYIDKSDYQRVAYRARVMKANPSITSSYFTMKEINDLNNAFDTIHTFSHVTNNKSVIMRELEIIRSIVDNRVKV